MALVKNNFLPSATYNQLPFIHDMEHAAETYKEDLDYLKELLNKHSIPRGICIKLIHIHFHLSEGEIVAFSEISAPTHGHIPFLGPMKPQTATKVYGCHYLVDEAGDLQAFEYTTAEGGVDLSMYPAFVAEFCAAVVQRGVQQKFGLAIKSGAAENGNWTELDYPEKRATFLLPGHISLPQSDHLVQRTTKTQFLHGDNEMPGNTHSHTEHYHSGDLLNVEENEPLVDGVTTKGGLCLTGMPLEPGTAFHTVVSAISAAA